MRQALLCDLKTYIVSVYSERVHWSTQQRRYLLKNVTLAEAKEHCQKAETAGLKVTLAQGEDSSAWFDV